MNSDPGSIQPLIGHVTLIIFLTFIHAMFAAAEIAFVSLNKTKIAEQSLAGDKKAKQVLTLLEGSDDFLKTIQGVLTVIGFFNGAWAAFHFTDLFAYFIGDIPLSETLSIVFITVVISYLMLVFGEQLPKAIAIQNPERTALKMSSWTILIGKLFTPINWLLNKTTNGLKRILPLDFETNKQTMTRDEFRSLLEESHQHEVIDVDEFSMLKGVLSLDHKIAREVMVPRTDAFMLDYDNPNEENIEAMLNTPHSRVPLYYEDKDNILGIIHVKNLLQASKNRALFDIDLKEIINEPLFIPETIYIDNLIFKMKQTRNQMAVLNDEYGGVIGIVTLEDLLEEIVGEIDDEYDETSKLINQVNEKEFIVEGATPLDKFNEIFNTNIRSEDVDTIAGFFIIKFGSIPSKDEDAFIKADELLLRAEVVDGSRILSLHVECIDSDEPTEEEQSEEDQM